MSLHKRTEHDYCYLVAAVGQADGAFEPDGYNSADGGQIQVDGRFYKYIDPDARCEKLYDDLILLYDNANCTQSPYHKRFRKERIGSVLILVDEFGTQMSSDYIGPSPVWANRKGFMSDPEIGEMLLRSRTIGGHMLWPVHKRPTINTARGGQNSFYDRIDLTLNEIRCMMLGNEQSRSSIVRRAIEAESPWFSLFKGAIALDRFKCFVDTFRLKSFVFDDDYKVISLAKSNLDKYYYVPISIDEPIFPEDFKMYVGNNLIAIEER